MTPPVLHVGWIAAVVVAVVALILTLAERRAALAGHFFAARLDDEEGRAFTAAVQGLRGPGALRGLPVIRRWIGRLGVRPDRRDDVIQDILETLWDLWPTFDPERGSDGTRNPGRLFERWVHGIARRVVWQHRERMAVRDRREVHDEPPEQVDPAPIAPEFIATEQTRLELIDRVYALPPNLCRVLIAHDLDEIPMVEVAAELGLPVSSTYKLRIRALTELQAEAEEGVARERRRIVVHDLQGFHEAADGFVSRNDVIRYLLATGWRRDDAWWVRGPNERDLIEAGAALPLLVARLAAAVDVSPRALLRAIEALATGRALPGS